MRISYDQILIWMNATILDANGRQHNVVNVTIKNNNNLNARKMWKISIALTIQFHRINRVSESDIREL